MRDSAGLKDKETGAKRGSRGVSIGRVGKAKRKSSVANSLLKVSSARRYDS